MSLLTSLTDLTVSIKLALSRKADKSELSAKENKGKITISGTENTVITHTLTVTDDGVDTEYTLLGV